MAFHFTRADAGSGSGLPVLPGLLQAGENIFFIRNGFSKPLPAARMRVRRYG
jgi:hypothetical protein